VGLCWLSWSGPANNPTLSVCPQRSRPIKLAQIELLFLVGVHDSATLLLLPVGFSQVRCDLGRCSWVAGTCVSNLPLSCAVAIGFYSPHHPSIHQWIQRASEGFFLCKQLSQGHLIFFFPPLRLTLSHSQFPLCTTQDLSHTPSLRPSSRRTS